MLLTLITFALMMGLSGGPHCLMMCGPACSLITKIQPNGYPLKTNVLFFTGRALGYGSIGALAAMSMETLGWLSTQSTLFRPIWNFTHVLAMVLGLFLMIFANQPLWLGEMAKSIWKKIELYIAVHPRFRTPGAILVIGAFWSFLPCSLLYSVLMLAALSANALDGALIMLSFSIGGALFMGFGAHFFHKLRSARHQIPPPQVRVGLQAFRLKIHQPPLATLERSAASNLGVRLAGLALFANSGWIMYHDLILNQAPWCVTAP